MINLIVNNPIIKPLRSDRSFRLEVDLNFVDFDKFKDLPKYEQLELIILPFDPENHKKNPWKYFYKLLGEIAKAKGTTVEVEEMETKAIWKFEHKSEILEEVMNAKIIPWLEKKAGRRPPIS